MSTRAKQHRLCLFMTPADESRFGAALLAGLPAVRYLDTTDQAVTPTPAFRSAPSDCAGHHVTIVDTSIVSEEAFHRDCVVRHPSGNGWVYAIVGAGLASLVRWQSGEDGLRNWELRATVPAGDPATASFVRALFQAAREGGSAVYAIDPLTREPARRAERDFVAWPDAATRFGARSAARLTNGPQAWFTVER